MTIHWEKLLGVFVVSFGTTVAVVALVTLALLGLSALRPGLGRPRRLRGPRCSQPPAGTAVAAVCLAAAAVIVLFGSLGDRRPIAPAGPVPAANQRIPKGSDMTYSLGVDLGTTFVAAAVARAAGVEMFTLGDRTVVMPAVVYPGEDGSIITGDAANRRAVSHPDLVGREIKRNLGDPTPLMLSSVPYPVTTLLGALLRDVMQKVIGAEGRPRSGSCSRIRPTGDRSAASCSTRCRWPPGSSRR